MKRFIARRGLKTKDYMDYNDDDYLDYDDEDFIPKSKITFSDSLEDE
jgi:hypothetical protein